MLLLVGFVVYAMVGTYTRRVDASGVIMPHSGLITVASPAAGIVHTAPAAEGAKVAKGDLLYEIDLDATSSDGPTQERVIGQLRDEQANLRRGRDLRQSAAALEKQALANQMQNLVLQHTQLGEQIRIGEQAAPLQQARMDELRVAVRKGLVLQQEVQNQAYLNQQAEGQLGQFRQAYIQLEGKVDDVQAQIVQFDGKLAQTLDEMDRAVLRIDQQITQTEAKRSVRVVAPEAGTLTAIRSHAGQPVASGTALVTLLQAGAELEAHLYVDSSAIGLLREGAPVLLRYAAFPYQRFGLYQGRIREVTRAPVTEGGADGPPQPDARRGPGTAAGSLYRLVVTPRLPYVLVDGAEQGLQAGMRVDASIALDKRPLYRWLLDPLDSVRHSLIVVSGSAT